jgi:hypothetical protein
MDHSRRSVWRVWLVAGGIALTIAACTSPLPTVVPSPPIPTGTVASPIGTPADASPSPQAVAPYRLSAVDPHGSPTPVLPISSGSDCATLPSDWLRSVCQLALRSDWHAIIAPTDPSVASITWWASLARATIAGDTTLCADASMRMWISMGSMLGAAPPPGSTPAPRVHPIAACIAFLQETATKGSFVLNDQTGGRSSAGVRMLTAPGAADHAALGVAPVFDPLAGCVLSTLTRDTCNQLFDSVTTALGWRSSSTAILFASGQPITCQGRRGGSCPSPASGNWLGSVSAGQSDGGSLDFDVSQLGGGLNVVAVPGPDATSPGPTLSFSPQP